jgi:hypothetical protein
VILRPDDWIEIRSKEEILATLDDQGRLEGLPFMPEMFQYCGKRYRVYKAAHKTCDTVSGSYVGRRLPGCVHLEHRCDGSAHGGCQAGCLIFWKEAWLKPATGVPGNDSREVIPAGPGCTEEQVRNATHPPRGKKPQRYFCQATELLTYTQPLKWWDARQYVEDYTSGNTSLGEMFHGFAYFAYVNLTFARRRKLGVPGRWLYDRFQSLRGGLAFPRHVGSLKSGKDAPTGDLNLQPGDLVRIKPYQEILTTVDSTNKNRGLFFDAEMIPNCGGTYRVRTRIEKFIDESTGKMKKMKTPAVILEGVHCCSRYSEHRLFCPRSIFTWWREIWLERVPEPQNEPRSTSHEQAQLRRLSHESASR